MHAEGTPRSHVLERSAQPENQINGLQSQVAALRTSESSAQQDYMRTMVIGGLDALPSLPDATTWLTTKLSALQGPSHIGTYMKSQVFQGLLFFFFFNRAPFSDCLVVHAVGAYRVLRRRVFQGTSGVAVCKIQNFGGPGHGGGVAEKSRNA